jgi:KDEL-tailed cysteine endopeptidase
VATVESLNIIYGGQALDLSEQELLDCDVADQIGCTGGYVDNALRWIQAKGGVVTEAVYPYQAQMGQCKTTGATRYGKITGLQQVRGEPQLQLAVLQRPVAVLIDAHGTAFQNYRTGIYKGPCTTQQNHAVVLIGYGVTNSGEKYWILKNSWGNWWGQNGFFFMRRGADGAAGLCGLAVWGYYPTM